MEKKERRSVLQPNLEALFKNALNGIYQCTEDGEFLAVNAGLVRMLGYEKESELRATNLYDLFMSSEDRALTAEHLNKEGKVENAELTFKCRDGRPAAVLLNARVVRHPQDGVLYHEGIVTDFTQHKRLEEQLEYLATHDPLTGLYNRRQFEEILEHHLSEVRRYGTRGALLWMDLDAFKEINDSLGHKAGDELLASLAQMMKEMLRESDVLARPGGDELAFLLPNADAKQAELAAARILGVISRHVVVISGQSIRTTASIGIVLFPEHGTEAGELLMKADMAMYRAKEEGRNRFCKYSPDKDRSAAPESRIVWVRRIREALETDGFVLYAQPILDLKRDQICGYEILLRLLGEDKELILPGNFLDVAEEFGLSSDIDRMVLEQTLKFMTQVRKEDSETFFAVNLSARSLSNEDLLDMIKGEPALKVIAPGGLVLEITETAAISNIHAAKEFVHTLKLQGCQFSLDDFGMGFSSFYQLKSLEVDYLKIDGSFIRNLAHDPVDQHLVQAMVHLGRSLGKKMIAEWVEDEETLDLLREYGVDCAQGYHIGRPQPLPEALRN